MFRFMMVVGMILAASLGRDANAAEVLPTVDLSNDTARQVVVAAGTPTLYQGHPTTLLLPDGKTMFCVWTQGHGGPCGPMKRSDDGGKTWSELLAVPENWTATKNCPALYRLVDPQGVARLFVFAGQGPGGTMHQSHSTDEGKTWSPMTSNGLTGVMPFCSIVPIRDGKALLAQTNIRRPNEKVEKQSNIIAQSISTDGGLTWSAWKIVLDLPGLKPCEPWVLRSPDGKQLLSLLRENSKTKGALYITSNDEGETWSESKQTPPGLYGDRHAALKLPDGRMVVCMRDTGKESPTKNHFVAWVGRYEDITSGKPGEYRIKLLHSYAGSDCGYPGVVLLPDGTIVATTYIKYKDGAEKHSVVSTRWKIDETDKLAAMQTRRVSEGEGEKNSAQLGDYENLSEEVKKALQEADRGGLRGFKAVSSHDSNDNDYDICIYGGTSGGVVAAVQAARMGKRVILLEPGKHLGGMTAGGLSAVDIGDPRSVGGIAREYLTRLTGEYGKTLAWDKPFVGNGGPATGGSFAIEPHRAENLFKKMIDEAKVKVVYEARLKKAHKTGPRITSIETDDGQHYRARVFIDTTYEGDLMAAAGVSYTVEREGNAKYGERFNGIWYDTLYKPRAKHLMPGKNGRVTGGQGVWDRDFPLDPYVKKGDPSSGLLPFIQAGEPGKVGEPAPGVQAYCYRLCLTTAKDRIAITPPADYDPARYEIVVRFLEACRANGDDVDLRWFSKYDPLPNEKYDFNTATFGANLPGASWAWPEASYDKRKEIAAAHENAHRGLLHFLATDERVPEKVRREMQRFGLPRDEFTDNGGWPHQIYVREGRRMISDQVLTEHHTFGKVIAPDPISLGSYGTDTHEIRRIVKDGVVTREGKTAGGRDGAGPYPIGYGAIVPRASECDNLLVTFALSASHTAFSSIRMEPVFMCSSQSAATAACLACDDDVAIQAVDRKKLAARLLADKQVLEWKTAAKE